MLARRWALAMLALLPLLGGCGDDDDGDSAGAAQQSEVAQGAASATEVDGAGDATEAGPATSSSEPASPAEPPGSVDPAAPTARPGSGDSDVQSAPTGQQLEGACALLAETVVEQATGENVLAVNGSADTCNWTFAPSGELADLGAVLVLTLEDVAAFEAGRSTRTGTVSAVEGVGDEAYRRDSPAITDLHVLAGDRAFTVGFQFASPENPASGDARFAALEQELASVVVENL